MYPDFGWIFEGHHGENGWFFSGICIGFNRIGIQWILLRKAFGEVGDFIWSVGIFVATEGNMLVVNYVVYLVSFRQYDMCFGQVIHGSFSHCGRPHFPVTVVALPKWCKGFVMMVGWPQAISCFDNWTYGSNSDGGCTVSVCVEKKANLNFDHDTVAFLHAWTHRKTEVRIESHDR